MKTYYRIELEDAAGWKIRTEPRAVGLPQARAQARRLLRKWKPCFQEARIMNGAATVENVDLIKREHTP